MFLAIKADVRPKGRRETDRISIKEIIRESFKLVHKEVANYLSRTSNYFAIPVLRLGIEQ